MASTRLRGVLGLLAAASTLARVAPMSLSAPTHALHLSHARPAFARPLLSRAARARVRAFGEPEAEANAGGGGLPAWLPGFVVPALGGALFGYDIGAVSAVARILGQPEFATASFGAPLNEIALGQIATLPLFGGMVASFAITLIGDTKVGRLAELKLASVTYFFGTLACVLAPTLPALLIGRATIGVGIGIALHAAPLYIAECAPPEKRGKLIAFKEAAIVSGIVLGYAAGAITGEAGQWRETFAPAFLLEGAMLLQALRLPESPRWLALRGRMDEAAQSIAQLRRCDLATATAEAALLSPPLKPFSEVTDVTDGGASQSALAVFPLLVSEKSYRDALVIGCGLVLFQQLSGQPSVLYYANSLLGSIGLGYFAAVGVGCFKLLMTIVSANLVESPDWGRRPLLLTGTTAMAVSLFGLSALYATAGPALAAGGAGAIGAQAGVIALLFMFVGGYQIGFGPITWLVLSEIFPAAVRSPAMSIGTLLNFGSNYAVGTLFELERVQVGEPVLFAFFGGVSLLALLFIYTKVPETRGLSLEQIEEKLKGGGPLS
mmetsp:Transcript_35118/g.87579  ORF Transcript_35118/g.87579 Transcript_35118/m.87579 type:complete len:550 (+) Transcript_35118:83-1732(+)